MLRKILQTAFVLPVCILAPLGFLTLVRPNPVDYGSVFKSVFLLSVGCIGCLALIVSIFSDSKKESLRVRRALLFGLLAGIVLDLYMICRLFGTIPADDPNGDGVLLGVLGLLGGPLCVGIWNLSARWKRPEPIQATTANDLHTD